MYDLVIRAVNQTVGNPKNGIRIALLLIGFRTGKLRMPALEYGVPSPG